MPQPPEAIGGTAVIRDTPEELAPAIPPCSWRLVPVMFVAHRHLRRLEPDEEEGPHRHPCPVLRLDGSGDEPDVHRGADDRHHRPAVEAMDVPERTLEDVVLCLR